MSTSLDQRIANGLNFAYALRNQGTESASTAKASNGTKSAPSAKNGIKPFVNHDSIPTQIHSAVTT